MSEERIAALERQVAELTQYILDLVAGTTARTVIVGALVELIGRAGVRLDDVRDVALDAAAGMPAEVDTAVRSLLAEPLVGTGILQ